jgi:hypothetical protein
MGLRNERKLCAGKEPTLPHFKLILWQIGPFLGDE